MVGFRTSTYKNGDRTVSDSDRQKRVETLHATSLHRLTVGKLSYLNRIRLKDSLNKYFIEQRHY